MIHLIKTTTTTTPKKERNLIRIMQQNHILNKMKLLIFEDLLIKIPHSPRKKKSGHAPVILKPVINL